MRISRSAMSSGRLKVLTFADYGRANRITSTALSPDGKWMPYAYQPNDGDAALYTRQLDDDKLYTIPVGSAPVFLDDSRPINYFVSPPNGRPVERAWVWGQAVDAEGVVARGAILERAEIAR